MRALTKKQKAFIKNIPESDSLTQAALKAGYSPATAVHIKDNIIASPAVQRSLKESLETGGITSDYLREKIKEGLEASRSDLLKGVIPDFAIRHKYLETAIKVKGELIDRTDITSGGKPIPLLGGITNGLPTNNSITQTPEAEEED